MHNRLGIIILDRIRYDNLNREKFIDEAKLRFMIEKARIVKSQTILFFAEMFRCQYSWNSSVLNEKRISFVNELKSNIQAPTG